MFETIYKTKVPEELNRSEYYQVHLDEERGGGRAVYFVREKHGWYDGERRNAIHPLVTLSPDEGFSTRDEAERVYQKQLHHRASEGFIHSFAFDPFEGVIYRCLA